MRYDVGTQNGKYWRKRFEQMEAARHVSAQAYVGHIKKAYIAAQREVSEKIESWYGRFARDNKISRQDARERLNNKELAEFRWDVQTYISKAKENRLTGEWTQQLKNASARVHISRLEALQLQMQQSIEKLFGSQPDDLNAFMKRTYLDSYYKTAFEVQRGAGVGFDIAGINQRQLERVVRKPWAADGENFSSRIWKQKDKLVNELHIKLSQATKVGKNPNELVGEIADRFGVSRGKAGRLVHTEMAFFADAAEQESFMELGVEEYQILATLDGKTCKICGPLDLKVFKMSEYEPGVTAIPFHPGCRCTRAPRLDGSKAGERIARDQEGKSYYVPADMPYEEWRELYVMPGEGVEQPVFPDELPKVAGFNEPSKAPRGNDPIRMPSSFEEKLGEEHTKALGSILREAPQNVKDVLGEYAHELKIKDAHHKGAAHYSSDGIRFDIEREARGIKSISGAQAASPYSTVFHEVGHNLDALMADSGAASISKTFRSGKLLKKKGEGYTLEEMLKKEGGERISSTLRELKKQAELEGRKVRPIRADAYSALKKEMLAKPILGMADVSDIWDGITRGRLRVHFGHGKKYWETHSVGTEAFAEMFSATAMEPKSLEQIKHYFPESYKIFEELLEEVTIKKRSKTTRMR